ncbi:hypothetical protein [Lacticaseibacillus absianus]|uniref:hypothetical protein n=1 Tax=Lacticaseibacillus absianus TaxID=2729623 RepID=UPI0015CCD3D6|nr:hypothetical protein [Lacticaseibacillus absianus]
MFKHNLFHFAPDAGNGGSGAPAGSPAAATDPAPDPTADLLKDVGVDSIDDLKAIVQAHADAEAANRTDLQAAQAELDKTTGKLSKESSRADNAEAQLAAYKQGVAESHIGDALALARVELADKANPAKTIDEALKSVLTRNPAFKGEGTAAANADGTAIVDDPASGAPTGTTLSDFIKMKTADQLEFKRTHPAEYAGLFK